MFAVNQSVENCSFALPMFLSENHEEIESINENDYFALKTLLNHQNLYG